MSERVYTLVSEGGSDRVLTEPINWLLSRHAGPVFEAQHADLGLVGTRAKSLADKLAAAAAHFPCDLLFVHRDADGEPAETRRAEVLEAALTARLPDTVSVVPVVMTEAWLIWQEQPIREAAGNPAGRVRLQLPKPAGVESERQPKRLLHAALKTASGVRGRRLRHFRVHAAVHRVAQLTEDWSPALQIPGFARLERDICERLKAAGWGKPTVE